MRYLILIGLVGLFGCAKWCDCPEECPPFTNEMLGNPDLYDARLDYDGDGELSTVDYGQWLRECGEGK